MEIDQTFNEVQAIKGLQKDMKNISKYFDAFGKLKTGDAEVLDELDKALHSLPPGENVAMAVEEFRVNAQRVVDVARQHRAEGFKRCETAFIRQAQEDGKRVREFTQGWRVGCLEMKVQREQARAAFLYNGEAIAKLQSVASVDDLILMEKNALLQLEKAALPEDTLVELFWEAYEEACRRNQYVNAQLVPLVDFYRELRMVLLRSGLKKVDGKLNKFIDFPRWAFVYNLDRYRALGSGLPETKRLVLQTGSMNEVSKGRGFTVNGLDAMNEYKVMCYVLDSNGGSSI